MLEKIECRREGAAEDEMIGMYSPSMGTAIGVVWTQIDGDDRAILHTFRGGRSRIRQVKATEPHEQMMTQMFISSAIKATATNRYYSDVFKEHNLLGKRWNSQNVSYLKL